MILGLFGFVHFTAPTGLSLEHNDALDIYTYSSTTKNPLGLVGVFASSFVWIVVGVWLYRVRSVKWFLLVQIAAFAGQGGAAPLKDLMGTVSNLLEWVVTIALAILVKQLGEANEEQKELQGTLLDKGGK